MKTAVFTLMFLIVGLATFTFASDQTKNITGAFVQLNDGLAKYDRAEWKSELELMRDIGIDTVIIQYSAYGDRFYYPSKYIKSDDVAPDESIAELVWKGSARTSFVKVIIEPTSVEWTMIPEVSIKKGEEVVSLNKPYTTNPEPSQKYPANGKLTDGSANYAWGDMVGWQSPERPIEILIDLEGSTVIDSVYVKFMRSEISALQLPQKGFEVFLSNDGKTFMAAGKANWSENRVEEANDSLGELLKAADELNMDVFLGLALNPAYWSGEFDPKKQSEMNQRILTELFNLYGSRKSLAGWYLPEEIDDRSFSSPSRKDSIKTYLKSMATYAKFLTRKPVMISPYFGINPDGEAYAVWWDNVLSEVKIDIIAMQDGVGTRRTTVEESAAVMKALKPVMDKHGVEFWLNAEVFDQIHGWPVDSGSWQAVPAEYSRVARQLELQSPFVEKVIIFDFPSYMSPGTSVKSEELYLKYKEALSTKED